MPVSAVILACLKEYADALEHFPRPLNQPPITLQKYPICRRQATDPVYFQFPDLTRQAEFLYYALAHGDRRSAPELDFLLGFDRAKQMLNDLLDWPNHIEGLFIRVVHGNQWKLSANKRKSHFYWMCEEEIEQTEDCVKKAFVPDVEK